MKKVLLGLICFTSVGALAQTFTADDTLTVGKSQIYFSADTTAPNLDAITGTGVTWDYSTLLGYSQTGPLLDTIKYSASSSDYSSFSSSLYQDDLNASGGDYFKNYADSVLSFGYTFTVDIYPIKIMNNIDAEKILEFPMNQGDNFVDSVYGQVDVLSQLFDMYGQVSINADGSGTLLLGDSTFTNVLRIKMIETLYIDTAYVGFPINNDVGGIVTRTMYSYYDLANYDFPVFRHGTIDVNTNMFGGTFAAVYSVVELDWVDAGVEEEVIEGLSIYPNPSNDVINISSTNIDQLMIVNALGQTIQTIVKPKSIETIDISNLEAGIYFVQVKRGNATRTEKFTVK
ncbi:MAG: T9SS type A sorting domain-containing protein [Crocinitomicaceae bacterium]